MSCQAKASATNLRVDTQLHQPAHSPICVDRPHQVLHPHIGALAPPPTPVPRLQLNVVAGGGSRSSAPAAAHRLLWVDECGKVA